MPGCETQGAQGCWKVLYGIEQAKQDIPVGISRTLMKVCSVGLCNPWLFINFLLFLALLEIEVQSFFQIKETAFFQARKKGLIQVEKRETFFVTCYKCLHYLRGA